MSNIRDIKLEDFVPQRLIEYDVDGDFKEFLSLFDDELNKWIDLLDEIAKLKHVDAVPEEYLRYIEEMLGLNALTEFDAIDRRATIKALPKIWRQKGTEQAIKTFIASALGLEESQVALNITYTGADVGEVVNSMSHAGRLNSIDLINKVMTIEGDLKTNGDDVIIPTQLFVIPTTYRIANLLPATLNDPAVAPNDTVANGTWPGFVVDAASDPPVGIPHFSCHFRFFIGVKDPFKVHQFLVGQATSASTSTAYIDNSFYVSTTAPSGNRIVRQIIPFSDEPDASESAGYRANHGHFYLGVDKTKAGLTSLLCI